MKYNLFIYTKRNIELNSTNSLQESSSDNVGAKLEIWNNVAGMPKDKNFTYSLKYETYNNTKKINDIETDNLTIENVSHVVSNEFYLNETNNYTFQINVNHTEWHNISIDKDSLSKNTANIYNKEIVEYLFYFNWIFNIKSETFELRIENKFRYKLNFNNVDTNTNHQPYGYGFFSKDTILSYSFGYYLNPPSPGIDSTFSEWEIVGIVGLACASFIFIIFALFILYAGRTIENFFTPNRTASFDRNLLNEWNEFQHEIETSTAETEV